MTARSFSRKTSLFRNRSRFSSSREATPRSSSKSTSRPIRTRAPLLRTRFRNVLSRKSPAPTTTTTTPPTDPFNEESFTTLNPDNDPEDESNKKIMIVGAHLEPEEPEEQALHLGVFKPKAGIREKLRETLHTVLEHEMAERGDHREEEEPSTIAPLSTVTISRNTRIKDASQRERVKSFVGRQRKLPSKANKNKNGVSPGSNRYVTIQRDSGTTPTPDTIDDSINQVLIDDNENLDESDDHVHDLVHEHHPEIHFRHLKPDLLPEEPRLSTQEIGSGVTIDISDIVDETHSTSNEMFLPTTLPPSEKPVEVAETNEKVPATAQAFLPTVDKAPTGGFLPTVSRASSRFRGSSRRTSATEPSPPSVSQSRRDKVKFRRRNRIESKASSNQETETSRPRESVSVPRTRTRTRTRTRSRVASEKKEDNLEEKEEDEDKKPVPSRRITNPRRLVSRARSKSAPVFRANTSSRPRTSFRNNQRLRVRGGGRRSTEAPETTEITERHAVVSSTVKTDFEDETEKSLEELKRRRRRQ